MANKTDERKSGGENSSEKQLTLVLNSHENDQGMISISQNVIAQIIKKNVLAVKGVARFAPKGIADLANLFSERAFDSSIAIEFRGGKICITLSLFLYLGAVIPAVIHEVQAKVKEQIEALTSASVERVDVMVKDLIDPEQDPGEESAANGEEEDPALKK